jgi:type IX secretion system PorP/SprF family membrane protein
MIRKIFYGCILILGTLATSHAQTDPMFLQQFANRILLNPASTGKGGDIYSALAIRQQWIGFPGPTTQALYVNGFVQDIRSGFGLTWINDKFGPQQTNNIKLNYAYFIPFDEIAFLSLGIGMGVMNNTYNELGFFARELDDLALMNAVKQSKTIPDFDFGFEFNMPQWEIGASVTHITYMYGDQNLVRPMRNIYAYTRVKVPMNKYWDFIPGVTWHNTRKMNTYELLAGFRYNNNLYVNLVYRNPMDCGLVFGINIYGGVRVAYSYDYGFDSMSKYNDGSHELTLSYNIPMNTSYVRTRLRFFRWKMF